MYHHLSSFIYHIYVIYIYLHMHTYIYMDDSILVDLKTRIMNHLLTGMIPKFYGSDGLAM
jgi:hypothetical protein